MHYELNLKAHMLLCTWFCSPKELQILAFQYYCNENTSIQAAVCTHMLHVIGGWKVSHIHSAEHREVVQSICRGPRKTSEVKL